MEQLKRSDVAVRRLRVIMDALWMIKNDSARGAQAALQNEINETNRETGSANVTYLPRMPQEN